MMKKDVELVAKITAKLPYVLNMDMYKLLVECRIRIEQLSEKVFILESRSKPQQTEKQDD